MSTERAGYLPSRGEGTTLEQIADFFQKDRLRALEVEGFGGWGRVFEREFNSRLIPDLSLPEGEKMAEVFEGRGINLRELQPTQPEKTTEAPIMAAITADLEQVFGNDIEDRIASFVKEKLMYLRDDEGTGEPEKPNRFLVMAAENVLHDFVVVARVFQLSDADLRKLYPDEEPRRIREAALANLSLSLMARLEKGDNRQAGYCRKAMHREHIWNIRGLRDIPPGGVGAIGNFLDSLLKARE
jgi:hypothetical protein